MKVSLDPKDLSADFSLTELATHLTLLCGKQNKAYDLSRQPVKCGPDVYLFYATELDALCRKKGICCVEPYFALTGGGKVTIMRKSEFES